MLDLTLTLSTTEQMVSRYHWRVSIRRMWGWARPHERWKLQPRVQFPSGHDPLSSRDPEARVGLLDDLAATQHGLRNSDRA